MRVILILWLASMGALGFVTAPDPAVWYVPEILGVILGTWAGFRFYWKVARVHDRAQLFLAFIGSGVLLYAVAIIFVLPYMEATNSFNALFGVRYSTGAVGFSASLAALGVPLEFWILITLLYTAYRGSRTVFIRYE